MSRSFTLSLKAFEQRAGAHMDDVVRKVATDVLARVVLRSPVDTGRFRAAWGVNQSGIEFNVNAVVQVDKSGNVTISRGIQAIQAFTAGEKIVIYNPMPYGQRLEYGWSKQAPAGMVRLTLAEFDQILQKAKRGG